VLLLRDRLIDAIIDAPASADLVAASSVGPR